jgi:hypothetical protein
MSVCMYMWMCVWVDLTLVVAAKLL